jgi:hypothetical protein
MAQIIRTSDRALFKRCRQRWDFTSKIRQNWEPLRTPIELDFGTAVHAGLESYYSPVYWGDLTKMEDTSRKDFAYSLRQACGDLEDYEELRQLGLGMLDHYFLWAPDHDDFTPIFVEQEFEVPIPGTSAVYQGRIDMIAEDRYGYYIVDHKTTATFGSTEWLALDDQCSSYAWALRQKLGLEIRGVIYNELRKKLPHRPKVLRNGSLSTDRAQETTHAIYLETIIDEGLDIEDYGGFLAYLSEYPKEFFRRTRVTFTPKMLELVEERIRVEAIDMITDPRIYPTPSKFNCTGCPFMAPCIALYEGSDYESILKENYQRRTDNA